MIKTTSLAHLILTEHLNRGDEVIDATVGNGYDTLFLCETVGATGRVYGFDIQEEAIKNAAERVANHTQAQLYQAGHETMLETLSENTRGKISAIMFNLGYLPGTDKSVITQSDTTIKALNQALELLAPKGLITLMLYPGHEGGDKETKDVLTFSSNLSSDYFVTKHDRINASGNPPILVSLQHVTRQSIAKNN